MSVCVYVCLFTVIYVYCIHARVNIKYISDAIFHNLQLLGKTGIGKVEKMWVPVINRS